MNTAILVRLLQSVHLCVGVIVISTSGKGVSAVKQLQPQFWNHRSSSCTARCRGKLQGRLYRNFRVCLGMFRLQGEVWSGPPYIQLLRCFILRGTQTQCFKAALCYACMDYFHKVPAHFESQPSAQVSSTTKPSTDYTSHNERQQFLLSRRCEKR